jgi:two-component sensor histidine kinase
MKKYLLIIFLVTLPGLVLQAQSIDPAYGRGLKQSLETETVDTARITILRDLGKFYMSKYFVGQKREDMDTALTLLWKAIRLSETTKQDDKKFESIRTIGSAYMFLKDTAAARPYIMQALQYYTAHKQFQKVVYTWIKYGESADRNTLYPLGMQCFKQALTVELDNNLKAEELYIRFRIAQETNALNGPDEAIKNCLSIIEAFKNRNENLDQVYWLLAHNYRYKGDIKKSLGYCLTSVNEMELHNDTLNAGAYYGELALTYDVLGQAEKSIFYYKKTIVARLRFAMPEEFIYRTEGFVIKGLIKLGKINEALEEALSFEASHPPLTPAGKAFMAQNKAYCYQALKEYDKAEKYFLEMGKGIDLSRRNDEVINLANYDISNFYLARKQYDKAQLYARQMGGTVSVDNLKNAELLRFKIDSATGDYKSALTHYGNYQKAKDSLFNELKSKQIAELQIKYETDQKQKNIEILKKESLLQHDKVKHANNMMNLTFVGIILALAVLGLLYKNRLSDQKKSEEIALKNASLNQLLTEKDNLLEEKEWLVKEVHHRVKNNLQIVTGLLQRQSAFINNKEALTAIRNSEHRMHSIALIHQKLYQSDNLTLVSMPDYIGEMIDYLRESFDLSTGVQFEKDIEDIELEINVAVPLGLILNEAITNAIKYAFAAHQNGIIGITLKQTADHCYMLKVADNGRGLPDNFDVKNMDSMGYNLMKGLSKQVGGKLELSTKQGVAITINFCPDLHPRSV